MIKAMSWLAGLALLVGAIAAYSFGESIRAYFAAESLPDFGLTEAYPADLSEAFSVKRKIQKHFLDMGVYLPVDDIFIEVGQPDSLAEHDRLTFLMRKACGQAKLYIWLPLTYKLPLKGRFVSSWCWKAQLSKTATKQS